ncbi:hypothetical protein MRP26_21410 [Bacillus sp. CCB-MMP212]|uniref:hypothetical protein n=1 Tax=Bacillus sp. CCB-MMP212 TaxID=2928002 RepID=UPI001F61B965|nr:hypothetical protein [Bacillus sp. CCB-MMP212]MCI4251490.1 hypothetical protein [Bacillus sp. CCB-MMP212]
MLTIFAKISTAILLMSIAYWMYYLDKNKKDERGEQVVGRASKYAFLFSYILLGFFAILHLNGYILVDEIFNFLVIIISIMAFINSLLIFVFNKKLG